MLENMDNDIVDSVVLVIVSKRPHTPSEMEEVLEFHPQTGATKEWR